MQPIWNVRATVIDLVPAGSGDEAIARLKKALNKAGFELYDDEQPDAFESEPLDEEDERVTRSEWANR